MPSVIPTNAHNHFVRQDDDGLDVGGDDATPADRFRHGLFVPEDYDVANRSDDDLDAADEGEDWTR